MSAVIHGMFGLIGFLLLCAGGVCFASAGNDENTPPAIALGVVFVGVGLLLLTVGLVDSMFS